MDVPVVMQRQMPVQKMVETIQFRFTDKIADDLSVDRKGSNHQDCEELLSINRQRPDIAGGANVNEDDLDVKACNQGIVFGYTTDETVNTTPLTQLITTRLGKRLTHFAVTMQRQLAAGAVELPQTLKHSSCATEFVSLFTICTERRRYSTCPIL